MAAAALEVALTDLELRAKGVSLASHLGGVHDRVPCGVSLGIEGRIEDLLELVTRFLVEGYRRIKLKIETVTSARVARGAIELEACRIINVKLGRVGGLAEALRIHDLARDAGVPLWVGGMLETGVGRAANVALASLPGFTLPGDTSASDRYFDRDLTEPFVVGSDGAMAVPDGPGLGVAPLTDRLEEALVERITIRP